MHCISSLVGIKKPGISSVKTKGKDIGLYRQSCTYIYGKLKRCAIVTVIACTSGLGQVVMELHNSPDGLLLQQIRRLIQLVCLFKVLYLSVVCPSTYSRSFLLLNLFHHSSPLFSDTCFHNWYSFSYIILLFHQLHIPLCMFKDGANTYYKFLKFTPMDTFGSQSLSSVPPHPLRLPLLLKIQSLFLNLHSHCLLYHCAFPLQADHKLLATTVNIDDGLPVNQISVCKTHVCLHTGKMPNTCSDETRYL